MTHAAWQVSIQHGIGVAEERSSLLGRWTFAFMEPMIRRGMVTQLRDADLPPLTLRDSTEDTTQRLHTAWGLSGRETRPICTEAWETCAPGLH